MESPQKTCPTRSEEIRARALPRERKTIYTAAKVNGTTVSALVRAAALRAAESILVQHAIDAP